MHSNHSAPSPLTLVAQNGEGNGGRNGNNSNTHFASTSTNNNHNNNKTTNNNAKRSGFAVTPRPATAGVARSLLPFVIEVMSAPPPSSNAGLLAATNKLAASAGLGSSKNNSGNNDSSNEGLVDISSEPFRSLLANTGARSRSKAAAKALIADSSSVSGAAGAALMANNNNNNNTSSSSSSRHHDPLFDVAYPAGCEKDPVLRAMLRIQRARVLSAAHSQAAAKAASSSYTSTRSSSPFQQRQSSARKNNDDEEDGDDDADENVLRATSRGGGGGIGGAGSGGSGVGASSMTNTAAPPRLPRTRPSTAAAGARLGYAEVDLDMNISATVTAQMLGKSLAGSTFGAMTTTTAPPAATRASTAQQRPKTSPSGGARQSSKNQAAADSVAAKVATILDGDVVTGARAVSYAIAAGVIPSSLDMESARGAYIRGHEDRISTAVSKKEAMVTKHTAELARAAEREARVKNRADFNARQRHLVTLVVTMRSISAMAMMINDEKKKRALRALRKFSAARISVWWKRCLQYRYLKKLQHSRKVIKKTMGQFVLRWKTLRYVRAAKCVATFLLATAGMNKQIRTVLAYRDYTRALNRVKEFLRSMRKGVDAQLRMVQMRWSPLEEAHRHDIARGICDALKGGASGVSNAPPQLVTIMRLLHITTMSDAVTRAVSLDIAAGGDGSRFSSSHHGGGGGGSGSGGGDHHHAQDQQQQQQHHQSPDEIGHIDIMHHHGAGVFDVAAISAQSATSHIFTVDGRVEVTSSNHAGNDPGMIKSLAAGGVSQEYGRTAGSNNDNNAPSGSTPAIAASHSLEIVIACLPVIPDYIKVPAIRNFLKYRRREYHDVVQSWRKKMMALRPHFERQRKQLELVQRLQWRGPPSMFVFDPTQLKLPNRPKPFRNMPSDTDLLTLIDRVMNDYFVEQSKIIVQHHETSQKEAAEAAAAAEAEKALRIARAAGKGGKGGGGVGSGTITNRLGGGGASVAPVVPASAAPRKEFAGMPPGRKR